MNFRMSTRSSPSYAPVFLGRTRQIPRYPTHRIAAVNVSAAGPSQSHFGTDFLVKEGEFAKNLIESNNKDFVDVLNLAEKQVTSIAPPQLPDVGAAVKALSGDMDIGGALEQLKNSVTPVLPAPAAGTGNFAPHWGREALLKAIDSLLSTLSESDLLHGVQDLVNEIAAKLVN